MRDVLAPILISLYQIAWWTVHKSEVINIVQVAFLWFTLICNIFWWRYPISNRFFSYTLYSVFMQKFTWKFLIIFVPFVVVTLAWAIFIWTHIVVRLSPRVRLLPEEVNEIHAGFHQSWTFETWHSTNPDSLGISIEWICVVGTRKLRHLRRIPHP